jgi:hypothetical protein
MKGLRHAGKVPAECTIYASFSTVPVGMRKSDHTIALYCTGVAA